MIIQNLNDRDPVIFTEVLRQSLCQNCGETIKGAQFSTARNVRVLKSFGTYQEISIAGKGVDLAYTYVKVAPKKYVNVATVIGCPATGMSKMITRQ